LCLRVFVAKAAACPERVEGPSPPPFSFNSADTENISARLSQFPGLVFLGRHHFFDYTNSQSPELSAAIFMQMELKYGKL
jgi:hypothetical protein